MYVIHLNNLPLLFVVQLADRTSDISKGSFIFYIIAIRLFESLA